MPVTRIKNNVIADNTIAPAKLNVTSSMQTFLSSATSANLAATIADETGSGSLVFATSPTLTSPIARGTNTTTGTAFSVQDSASSVKALFRNDGSVGINGYIPSTHNPPSGYAGVWLDTSNSGIVGEVASGFKGLSLVSNATRSSISGWTQQEPTRNSFMLSLGYEANNNGFTLYRAAAGSGNSFSVLFNVGTNGQMHIGGNSPNAAAQLQIDSTTRGFLPPRMTISQRNAIASPAEGLVVYVNDAGAKSISLHNGTAWGNVLTTHAASFTSDTLAAALTDENGTGGGFVRAEGATLTSPTISTSLTLNATSYIYGSGAAAAHRTSLSLNNVDNTSDADKPISRATQTALNSKSDTSHTHGNITSQGAIGATANLPLITTTSGVIVTGSFGTTANTFCQGNDSRLSDSREWNALTIDQTEAEAGTSTTRRAWTSQRVRQAVVAWYNTLSLAFRNFVSDPSSANLATLVSDETGSGSLVFNINPTITNFTESSVINGNSGTARTLSLTNGTKQSVTLTGNCTFTMPTPTAGKSFVLYVYSGTGGFTATFTGVKWPGNIAPIITSTANRYDIITFDTNPEGTAWSGAISQNYFA